MAIIEALREFGEQVRLKLAWGVWGLLYPEAAKARDLAFAKGKKVLLTAHLPDGTTKPISTHNSSEQSLATLRACPPGTPVDIIITDNRDIILFAARVIRGKTE